MVVGSYGEIFKRLCAISASRYTRRKYYVVNVAVTLFKLYVHTIRVTKDYNAHNNFGHNFGIHHKIL